MNTTNDKCHQNSGKFSEGFCLKTREEWKLTLGTERGVELKQVERRYSNAGINEEWT